MKSLDEKFLSVLAALTAELHQVHTAISSSLEWHKSHCGLATKHDLEQMEKRIMATSAELAADLKAVLAQQQKTSGEIATVQASVDTLNAKIVELEAIIAAGGSGVSQELVDAVAAVKAQAQVIDDQIPDVAAPPV